MTSFMEKQNQEHLLPYPSSAGSVISPTGIEMKGSRLKIDQDEFKIKLATFYQRKYDEKSKTYSCMVLNKYVDVKAAHIYPLKLSRNLPRYFGLLQKDIWSERNGLLIASGIEQAFDDWKLCFIYNKITARIEVLILDPELFDEKIDATDIRFSDINGKPLHHPKDCAPFKRFLSLHATRAHNNALYKRWITSEQHKLFEEFGSEGSVITDMDYGERMWGKYQTEHTEEVEDHKRKAPQDKKGNKKIKTAKNEQPQCKESEEEISENRSKIFYFG
jgi:hypothetical protein